MLFRSETERQSERARERDREGDRDRETDRETDRERGRVKDGKKYVKRKRDCDDQTVLGRCTAHCFALGDHSAFLL